jgi:tetratricopeptide (TPR) repeat protein
VRTGHRSRESTCDFRPFSAADPLLEALAASGATLLVLDNAETLAEALGAFCDHLLARVPRLRVLVTSRLPLGNDAEVCFPVGGLPRDAAAALFVHHARRARPYPPLSPEAVVACGDLAGRLGGHPLALVLAAGRLRVFSLDALESRIFPGEKRHATTKGNDDLPLGLPLLAAGQGRHRSLARVVETSVAGLPADLRRPLMAACTFRGGFVTEHFEAIVGGVEPLEALVACGLVYERGERFFPFEILREFVQASDENLLADAANNHLGFFSSFAAERLPFGAASEFADARSRDDLVGEEANLQEALDISMRAGRPSVPLALARTLLRIHPMAKGDGEKSPFEEGANLLKGFANEVVENSPFAELFYALRGDLFLEVGAMEAAARDFEVLRHAAAPATRALAGTKLALLHEIVGDYAQAYRAYDDALTQAGDAKAPGATLAGIYLRRAHTLRRDGELDRAAADLAAASLHLSTDGRSPVDTDLSLEIAYEEAILLLLRRSFEEADRRLAEGEQSAAELGAHVRHAAFVSARVVVALELENISLSVTLQQRALEAYRRLGQRYGVGCTLYYLARAWTEMGKKEEAERAATQSLLEVRAVAIPRYEALALGLLAVLTADREEHALARQRIDEADALLARCREPSLATTLQIHRGTVDGSGAFASNIQRFQESPSDDVRFAARLCARICGASRTVLTVRGDGRSVEGPDGLAIDLQRRLPLARVAAALATARVERPGEYLPMDRLIEAGWPGERMLFEAGKNRVQVALSELRALGLRPWIEGETGGYRLSPAVTVLLVPRV